MSSLDIRKQARRNEKNSGGRGGLAFIKNVGQLS